jgi:hypothetical protein
VFFRLTKPFLFGFLAHTSSFVARLVTLGFVGIRFALLRIVAYGCSVFSDHLLFRRTGQERLASFA